MVKENSAAISFGILMPLFPAAAIALLTVAINLIIDWTGLYDNAFWLTAARTMTAPVTTT